MLQLLSKAHNDINIAPTKLGLTEITLPMFALR